MSKIKINNEEYECDYVIKDVMLPYTNSHIRQISLTIKGNAMKSLSNTFFNITLEEEDIYNVLFYIKHTKFEERFKISERTYKHPEDITIVIIEEAKPYDK